MKRFESVIEPLMWSMALLLVGLAAGCGGNGGGDPILGGGGGGVGVAATTGIIPGAACSVSGVGIPTVLSSNPTDGNSGVPTTTVGVLNNGKSIFANFSMAMDPATISSPASTFTLAKAGVTVAGSVTMNPANTVAILTTSGALSTNTLYTATITTGAQSAGAVSLACPYQWSFTTAIGAASGVGQIDLLTAQTFGTAGPAAGMTNSGNQTRINNGDIGTIAVGNGSIVGFHERTGLLAADDHYSDTLGADSGTVSGSIYTCTNSTTGANSAAASIPECAIATQALLDAGSAYDALVALPAGPDSPVAGNLANQTLTPGVYTAVAGTFMIQGGDLILDPQGDANAVWVFQMAASLLVGGPPANVGQNVTVLAPGQAKNVFWQVGSFATINTGSNMVGTIISQTGASFSTAGAVIPTTLNGRVLGIGRPAGSVTMVNTIITVPAP